MKKSNKKNQELLSIRDVVQRAIAQRASHSKWVFLLSSATFMA